MLPREHRIRRSDEFSQTIRSGTRVGGRNIVVSALIRPDRSLNRMGLVVSKAVGNSVMRNRISRRLREASRTWIDTDQTGIGYGVDVVVRALPAAATVNYQTLHNDLNRQLGRAIAKAKSEEQKGED